MSAAVRLWWLLRSTSSQPRDLRITAAFALVTGALLAVAGLLDVSSRQPVLESTLAWAVGALVVALLLLAGLAGRTLLRVTRSRRLEVLRATGASTVQTVVIGALDVADSALPGVLLGALTDVALAWALGRLGPELVPPTSVALVPAVLLTLAAAAIVGRRVRSAVAD